MVLYMLTIIISCKFNPSLAPAGQKATRSEKIEAFRGGLIEVFHCIYYFTGRFISGLVYSYGSGCSRCCLLNGDNSFGEKMDWNKTMLALLDSTKLIRHDLTDCRSNEFSGVFALPYSL